MGKCGREILSDESTFEEEKNTKKSTMLLMFLFSDGKKKKPHTHKKKPKQPTKHSMCLPPQLYDWRGRLQCES